MVGVEFEDATLALDCAIAVFEAGIGDRDTKVETRRTGGRCLAHRLEGTQKRGAAFTGRGASFLGGMAKTALAVEIGGASFSKGFSARGRERAAEERSC